MVRSSTEITLQITFQILVKYIKSVDGITGCYRGLFPKVCGNLVCAVTTEKILERLDSDVNSKKDNGDKDNELDGDEEDKSGRTKREDEK